MPLAHHSFESEATGLNKTLYNTDNADSLYLRN